MMLSRNLQRTLLPVILACVPVFSAPAADKLTTGQIGQIRQLSEAALSQANLPGLSVAVAKGDRVWSAGFGFADLEQGVPVDSSSLFRTASISKWLTATAAMRLSDAGKLDLDAPVQQYCPQFPRKQWTITARELLSHLSGIRHYYGANGEPRNTAEERKALDELVTRERSSQQTRFTDVIKPLDGFRNDPLLFEPGTRFLYSSLGYRLLGCVLEGAAQTSYQSLMRGLILAPAGMTGTTEDDALLIIPHRVAGYGRAADKTLTRAEYRDFSENLPAGGHLASAEDLVRFAASFAAGKLVKTATRDQMIARPRLLDGSNSPDAPTYFGQGPGFYYGMGIFVGAMPDGERVLLHTGVGAGTSTELLLLPDSQIAVALMTNVRDWNGSHALAMAIVSSLLSR